MLGAGWMVPEPPASFSPTNVIAIASDPCDVEGVRMVLDGTAIQVRAHDGSLAGHKYRPDGMRSPWATIRDGSAYAHLVGGFVGNDLGATTVDLLIIRTGADSAGFRLARAAASSFKVTRSNGRVIAGRFTAEVSQVVDTSRPPPASAAVVEVSGTFCLPAMPADPSDTAP
ncbi:MAG: hypothetical protein ABI867_10385 [Kofleriaceae bacterium]